MISLVGAISVFICGCFIIVTSTLLETPRAQEFLENLASKNKILQKIFDYDRKFTLFENPTKHIEMKMPKSWAGTVDVSFFGDCIDKREKMTLYSKSPFSYILEIFLSDNSINGKIKVTL